MDGNIHSVKFLQRQCIPLFGVFDSCIAAIAVHDEFPYVFVACKNGHLSLLNYETHKEVISAVMPESFGDDGELAEVTAAKYSKQSLHLACGKSNGELWMLHPILLTPLYEAPFKHSIGGVVKIVFSEDNSQLAYYDNNNTVFGLIYEVGNWWFRGKVRPHYKPIKNILFIPEDPCSLYTIGEDRFLIQYNSLEVCSDGELAIRDRDRIDQKDTPLYFICHPRKKFSKAGYFLLVDDKHKYKVLNKRTMMCTSVGLGPAFGCFRDTPVTKMEYLPNHKYQYLVFMNKNHIGLQLTPIDGNPFKYIAITGHPEELLDFQLSSDGQYLFTIGKNDKTMFVWDIKVSSVETLHQIGGEELQPFYCLLEGGKNGWLFQEMQDLFYYMQILHQGESVIMPRVVTDCISIAELPDLVRACGYYPTEYEIETLMTDIRYKDFDETGNIRDVVSFCDFVKLFINHRPVYGYTKAALSNAFGTLAREDYEDYSEDSMNKDSMIEFLTMLGEAFSRDNMHRCLVTLMRHNESFCEEEAAGRDFDFLPNSIDLETFTGDVLGIKMEIDVANIKSGRNSDSEESKGTRD